MRLYTAFRPRFFRRPSYTIFAYYGRGSPAAADHRGLSNALASPDHNRGGEKED